MAAATTTIDPSLLNALATKGTTKIIVSFKVGTGTVLKDLEGHEYPDRASRAQAVHDSLKDHADAVQAPVVEYLTSKAAVNPDLTFDSLWINNNLVIKNADLALVQELANFEEVKYIKEDGIVATILPKAIVE